MEAARGDDIAAIKMRILLWIPPVAGHTSLEADNANKSMRGWNHITTARLLCAANKIAEFDADPARCAAPSSPQLC